MNELSIKINIAGRIYPLTVKTEEEEGVRKAAKLINDRLKAYERDYAVKDKQDLLAMCALEFANTGNSIVKSSTEDEKFLEELRSLNNLAETVLSKQ